MKLDKELPVIQDVHLEKAGGLAGLAAIGGNFNEKVQFTVMASDQFSGLDRIGYKLDGDTDYTYLENGTNQFLVDHEYTGSVTIAAVDIAGNISEPYIVEDLVIDGTKPEIQMSTDVTANALGWHNADINLHFSVNDDDGIKSVEYTTDEMENTQSGTGVSGDNIITLINNGEYTLTVTATDNSDNVTTKAMGVKLDKELPVVTNAKIEEAGPLMQASFIGGDYDQKVKITVTANDLVSGVQQIGYKLDGADDYTLLDSGVREFTIDRAYSGAISIIVIDNADNQSEPYVIDNLVIEDTAPTLELSFAKSPNEYGWHNEDVVVNVRASDDGDVVSGLSAVTYVTDESGNPQSGTVSMTNGEGSITLRNEGIYTLTVAALDNSGNITTETLEIKLDKINPTVTLNAAVESNGVTAYASTDGIKNAVDVSEDMCNNSLSEILLKLQVNKESASEAGDDAALVEKKLNGRTPLYLDINLLGHSDISTTSNIYTHLDYSSKIASANAIIGTYPS